MSREDKKKDNKEAKQCQNATKHQPPPKEKTQNYQNLSTKSKSKNPKQKKEKNFTMCFFNYSICISFIHSTHISQNNFITESYRRLYSIFQQLLSLCLPPQHIFKKQYFANLKKNLKYNTS